MPFGWVLPGMSWWVDEGAVEWMNADTLRVDWTWKYDGRFCNDTSALPQQFRVRTEPAVATAKLVWQTTEGEGALSSRDPQELRKPPQSNPSRGGHRFG
jgi:hypothetical protein